MQSDRITWAVLLILALATAVSGIRFRRGLSPGSVRLYRRTAFPAVFRNLPLLWPLGVGILVPLLVFSAPSALGVDVPGGLSHAVAGFVLSLAWGVLFGSTGLLLILGSRVPRRLVPTWLQEQDDAMGFERSGTTVDWALVAVGIAMTVAGAAFTVVALLSLIGAV